MSENSKQTFARLQAESARQLVFAAWIATCTLAIVGILFGYAATAVAVTGSVLANIIPTVLVWRKKEGAAVHIAIGLMMAVHPAALLYLFQVQLWQIDMHMYFFVALAALTLLCDWRPLVAAGALTAVHHLILNYVAPEWVFYGGGQLSRVFVHALAVAIQVGALIFLVERVRILSLNQERERDLVNGHRAAADAARKDAEAALQAREAAETRAAMAAAEQQKAERQAEQRRRADMLRLAEKFEETVSSVASSLGTAAEWMSETSRQLRNVSGQSHQEAATVDQLARRAAEFAGQVAKGTGALAESVGEIAGHSGQQVRISADAETKSETSVSAVEELARRAISIEEFVGLIREISEQTNLLSLNATIEAARAGEAGRGFSVVAQEVKMLAARTAGATTRITELLAEVGDDAAHATGSICAIRGITVDLLNRASAISSAMEKQGRTTSGIDESARQAAQKANEISNEIERLMTRVSTTDNLAAEVASAAEALTKGAEDLTRSTEGFVSQLRAA